MLGCVAAGSGLIWLAHLPTAPDYLADILPPTLLIGMGIGPAMVVATRTLMSSVATVDSGLASGQQNTAGQLGGAIGIASLVALAQSVTKASEIELPGSAAKLSGFHAAFLLAGMISTALACLTIFLRSQAPSHTSDGTSKAA